MACKRSSVRPRYSPQINPALAGFFVYGFLCLHIIFFEPCQYYIGHTENLEDRIFRHTNSGSKSTKKANDWIVKYTEEFESRSAATQREFEIKNKKSRKYIEWLVSSVG